MGGPIARPCNLLGGERSPATGPHRWPLVSVTQVGNASGAGRLHVVADSRVTNQCAGGLWSTRAWLTDSRHPDKRAATGRTRLLSLISPCVSPMRARVHWVNGSQVKLCSVWHISSLLASVSNSSRGPEVYGVLHIWVWRAMYSDHHPHRI